MKVLNVELSEVFSEWIQDPSTVSCRISVQNQFKILNYRQLAQFELQNPENSDSVHILIQSERTVLGSIAFTLEWLLSRDLRGEFDGWIGIEVSKESMTLLTSEKNLDSIDKSLKIRIKSKLISEEKIKNREVAIEDSGEEVAKEEEQTKENKSLKEVERAHEELETKERSKENEEVIKEIVKEEKIYKEVEILDEEKIVKDLEIGIDEKRGKENDEVKEEEKYRDDKSKPKGLFEDFIEAYEKNSEQVNVLIENLKENEKAAALAINKDNVEVTDSKSSPLAQESALASDIPIDKPLENQLKQHAMPRPLISSNLSSCTYLNNLFQTEIHLKGTQSVLQKHKDQLGAFFSKLVQDAKNRESKSPSRSPVRKTPSSGFLTPFTSQRSLNTSVLSNYRTDEENTLDIFSNLNLDIERLSIQNIEPLAYCIIGLITKQSYANIATDEILGLKKTIEEQINASTILESAKKATLQEFSKESSDHSIIVQKLQESIKSIRCQIDTCKTKANLLIHEKEKSYRACEDLKKDMDQTLQSISNPQLLTEIRSLSEAASKLEKLRAELEEKIVNSIQDYKDSQESSLEIINKIHEDKRLLLSEINSVKLETEKLEKENQILLQEVAATGFAAFIDEETRRMKEFYEKSNEECSSAIKKLQSGLIKLRSDSFETQADSQILLEKFEKDTVLMQKKQAASSKSMEKYTETLSELYKKVKKLKQDTLQIDEALAKKQLIDKIFESALVKFNQSLFIKDSLINEAAYVSDFTLSFSQSTLEQNRLIRQIKGLVSSKGIELEALQHAADEIKSSNPVYFPLADDYIDEALAQYLNSRDKPLLVPFHREAYGIYYYGSKKVMINYERGKLIAKSGGGFIPIENFIECFTESEIEKQEKRNEPSPRGKMQSPRSPQKKVKGENAEFEFEFRVDTPIIEEDI